MNIEVNSVYRHYKGNYYRVLAISKHSETMENLIVYQGLYDNNPIWCRPMDMWNEEVYYNGKKVKRFELIEDYNG